MAPEIRVQYQAFRGRCSRPGARQDEDLGANTVMIRLALAVAR